MKKIEFNAVISSPVGKLGIKTSSQGVKSIQYLTDDIKLQKPNNDLAVKICKQLQSYFEDPRFEFDIPCDMTGTDYQKRIWTSLKTIPAGHPMTYSDIAQKQNSGARAVGGACRKNPIPIIFPCHRVIAKSGIGGYDGDWGEGKVNIKQWLLKHEGII